MRAQLSQEQQRAYVLQWEERGRLLDKIKRIELQAMSQKEVWQYIEDLLDLPEDVYIPAWRKTHSGFTDQQTFFRKFRP